MDLSICMWTAGVAYFVISRYLIWHAPQTSFLLLAGFLVNYLLSLSCGGLHFPLQIECVGYLEFCGTLQLILAIMNSLKVAEGAEETPCPWILLGFLAWKIWLGKFAEFCVYFADYGFLVLKVWLTFIDHSSFSVTPLCSLSFSFLTSTCFERRSCFNSQWLNS